MPKFSSSHLPLLSPVPASPSPSAAYFQPPAASPGVLSKPGFRHFDEALRATPSITKQLRRRATYLALFALFALSTYVLFFSHPAFQRAIVPLRAAPPSAHSPHPPANPNDSVASSIGSKPKGSSWRKASTKGRPPVQLDAHEELAAVTSFMASLAENRIPAEVDPARPLDPELILDFDTRSAGARDELAEVVRDTWRRNPVVLFSKVRPPPSRRAAPASRPMLTSRDPLPPQVYSPESREIKGILDAMNLAPAPTVFEVDRRTDAAVVEPLVARLTSVRELPILLIGGEPIGSIEEIRILSRDGALRKLVEAAGAKVDGKRKKGGRKH